MTAAGKGIPAPGHRETGEPMAGGSMGLPSKWRAAGPDGSLFPRAHHKRGERHRKDDEQDDPEQSFESGGPVRDEVQSSGKGLVWQTVIADTCETDRGSARRPSCHFRRVM